MPAALQQSAAPYAAGQRPAATLSPVPEQNRVDAVGQVSSHSLARRVFDAHKKGLEARRERDLISEMLLLHIDGSADFQWAVIRDGTRIEIPRMVAEFRKSENLLRLIVDNAIAHHTTMTLRYLAETMPDREARDQATVDTIWANHLAQTQDFNGLFAEAMYLAMPAGFCPVHCYWREDVTTDWYEPTAYGDGGQAAPQPGMPPPGIIDCFVGNPFGTVFDSSARRGSVRWSSYERWVPADAVRAQFRDRVPAIDGLEGTTKMPSSAEFQMIARDWMYGSVGMHGSPVMRDRRDSNEEMMLLVCRETAPSGRNDPHGRLQILAVPGSPDTRQGRGNESHALLLADQKLPGRDYSWTNFYSSHRGSDIHGKPWVEDIDQLQVDLNIALSKQWEVLHRMIEAPIVAPGGAISDDLADVGAYQLLEVDPSLGTWRPRVMEWPQGILPSLENYIKSLRSAMYTQGGYQAASRGEAPGSRTPYRAIVALQQADNTVHGPVNQRFQRSACDFMGRCHSQMRMYGHVPWLVTILGDDFEHLAESYIDRTKLSQTPPQFKLVNTFGASPELRAQEILELMTLRGADGQPFMTTEEARRLYPSPITVNADDPTPVKRRRAKTIAKKLRTLARDYRQQTNLQEWGRAHPWVQLAGLQVFYQAEQLYPRDRSDLLEAHIASLEEITQDETADPIARVAAGHRLEMYYQWQAMMAGIAVPNQGAPSLPAAGGQKQIGPGGEVSRADVSAEMAGAGGGGGATLDQTEEAGGSAPPVASTAR